MRHRSPFATGLVALGLALGLATGCSGDDDAAGGGSTDTVAAAPASVADEATGRSIIDVRTPEEYAAGHLEGAQNIDVQSADFEATISELPRDAKYFVYCRSGNRSARAAEIMAGLGFTDVVDGGGFEALVAAGVPEA